MPRPLLLSRCALVPALLWLAVPAQAQEAPRTLPVFVDGQAQVVEGFADPLRWIRHDLWVETEFDSDGDGRKDRVHVDVTRPEQTETEGLKVPVVYETSPYYSGTGTTSVEYMWNPEQELGELPELRENPPAIRFQKPRSVISNDHVDDWVPRGFAVVHSESVGTGQSQGCPSPGAEIESLAPKAVIDWLCGRAPGYTSVEGDERVEAPWSSGKVGMTGTSYNGTLPIACATTGVEGLEAIIPIAPVTSYYRYYRANGLVRHPGGYTGEDMDVLYDFVHSNWTELREPCDAAVRDGLLLENIDRVTGDWNDFWAERDYAAKLGKWRAATLMAHAFNDWNVMPEHSVGFYLALKERGVPVQCFFHQGGHGGPPPHAQMNRWFTRYLYGIENGVEEEPKAWVVREGARMSQPTAYPDYPNPEARAVALFPTKGGATRGGLEATPQKGQGQETLVDDVAFSGAKLAAAEQSNHRLLYASPELVAPVHVSGIGRITLRVAASKPATNLSVWLVALPWTDSRSINDDVITRGWADPQNAGSLARSQPLVPGEFVELAFELQPDDQIVAPGARIGLMLFASDRDFTLWPEKGTELTLDLDGVKLELPIVGGAEAWKKAVGG